MIYKWHKENYRKYVSNSFVTIGQNDKDNSAIYKTFENLFNFYESYVSLIFFFQNSDFTPKTCVSYIIKFYLETMENNARKSYRKEYKVYGKAL
jgi:hypothetical protein